jgi:hypothetical protein
MEDKLNTGNSKGRKSGMKASRLWKVIISHFAPGPWRILAGSMISAERKAKSPFIVIPTIRNGSNKTQTSG